MYSRPLQSSRRRPALLSDQARRASVRQLFFEELENRTLLAADLSVIDVRMTSASGLDSAPTMTTSPTLVAARGLRMAIVNETSPSASDAAVDDRLLLRLSVSDAVTQNLVGVESQVRVTFDSEAVAVDSTSEFEDVTFSLVRDSFTSLSYVFRSMDQEVQGSDAFVVEIPFRVIAAKGA